MKTGLGDAGKTGRIVDARRCFCRALDTVYVKLSANFRVFAKYFFNLLLPFSLPVTAHSKRTLGLFENFFRTLYRASERGNGGVFGNFRVLEKNF
jgi:hypothetical protein